MVRSRALLVGLTHVNPAAYQGWDGRNGCAGCELDVQNMAALLSPLGYEVQTLLSGQANRQAVLGGLRDAAENSQPGDTFLFFFAGHGGQQPDRDGDEDDGQDETLVAYDAEIIDDQLNEIWPRFRAGVRIIMLSDSCNSGTNYRMVRDVKRPTPIRPVSARQAQQMSAAMIHIGGCRDGRNSAGYSAGGAFTTTLVNVWASGAFSGDYRAFHQAICAEMVDDQEPQYNEYGPVDEAFRTAKPFVNTQTVNDPSAANIGRGLSADNQKLLLQAFQQMVAALHGGAPAVGVTLTVPPVTTAKRASTSGRHLVYVHGISQHTEHYSDPWWDALRPHTGTFGAGQLGDTRHEVLWSDLVNDRSMVAARAGDSAREEALLREQIRAVMEDRRSQELAEPAAASPEAMRSLRAARGSGMSVDDFIIYMTNDTMRQRIIDRFTTVVRPLLSAGAQVDIISHSWGTVVAYEGLRELDADSGLTGHVSNFFTVGSALSIAPVRWRLRSSNRDGARPRLARQWHNLDAVGDVVGGGLASDFAVDVEYLDLDPVGCNRNLGGLGWYDPHCAHGSYFREENRRVNEDIFAQAINASRGGRTPTPPRSRQQRKASVS